MAPETARDSSPAASTAGQSKAPSGGRLTAEKRRRPRVVSFSRIKRAGEGMGEFEGEGEAPLAPAATEWRPQAVPVATKEAR